MKRRTVRLWPYLFLLPLVIIVLPVGWRPHGDILGRIRTVVDWLVPALVGVTFITLGLLKVYGWRKGIVGGGDKSASCRLLGRCPSWSKQLNITMMVLFFGLGFTCLGLCWVARLKG